MMRRLYTFIYILLLTATAAAYADKDTKPRKVHGKATLILSENDNMTLIEAKRECVKRARYEAIKEAFGESLSSTTNIVEGTVNGTDISNFVEETTMSAKAEWVEDTKEPVVKYDSDGERIVFTAEVWGMARPITSAAIELDWKVLCGGTADSDESDEFRHKERIYIKFRAPVSGFLAIYLLDSTNKEASCLLPYKHNLTGRHEVMGGKDYIFFDKETDPRAIPYCLTTSMPLEMDQVVLIFSPNKFTKCNEITGDRRHPNSLSIDDFEAWLKRLKQQDDDMVVDRNKWIKIYNKQ